MKMIYEVTIIIKKKSFPSFIDELYKRDCDLIDLKHIEETPAGYLYTALIASNNMKRFDEFVTIIGSAGDKYKIESVKNIMEERIIGGLITVSGKMAVDNISDFNTSVMGATDLIHEKIEKENGHLFTSIARNVAILCGVKSTDEIARTHLLHEFAVAERDAVILNRFAGLNGFPISISFDIPEDVIKSVKRIERNFSAVRFIRIDEANIMLYDLLVSDLGIPVVSFEHDDIPLYLFTLIIKIMMKYRLKPEEATVGFIGIDLSVIRLTRVLDRIGFRRVLAFDNGEKNMLSFESQGGLATTAENIFNNADITLLMKSNFNQDEFSKIRPGQFVISLLKPEDLDMDVISGKGVREFISVRETDLLMAFPGTLRGMIDSGLHAITDAKLVEFSKKFMPLLSDEFEYPHLFSDIHERIYAIVKSTETKQ